MSFCIKFLKARDHYWDLHLAASPLVYRAHSLFSCSLDFLAKERLLAIYGYEWFVKTKWPKRIHLRGYFLFTMQQVGQCIFSALVHHSRLRTLSWRIIDGCSQEQLILVPRVFVPYCASLTKWATFESSIAGSNLIGFENNKMAGSKTPKTSLVVLLKVRHAQFNHKSDIFGLQIGTFQGRSFPDRWSKGTKTLKVILFKPGWNLQDKKKPLCRKACNWITSWPVIGSSLSSIFMTCCRIASNQTAREGEKTVESSLPIPKFKMAFLCLGGDEISRYKRTLFKWEVSCALWLFASIWLRVSSESFNISKHVRPVFRLEKFCSALGLLQNSKF